MSVKERETMIYIVTDSTATMPPDLVEKHQIAVVPLIVQMGSQTYHEGVNLTQEEFFKRLPTTDPLPTTSQPSPADFQKTYADILNRSDENEIISLHLSSELSMTYNSAVNGAKEVQPDKISVVDSRTVSAGLALLVLLAVKMANMGKSRQDIVKAIESYSQQSHLLFTLDTLEYLRRGGRIGGARALIGSLLRIKPILELKNGRLGPGKRGRSRRKALQMMVKQVSDNFSNQPIWVALANAQSNDMNLFQTMLQDNLNIQEFIVCQIGPVVATHTGPNTLGVAVMPAPEL